MIKLEQIVEAVADDGQVCPMPAPWKELWEMLPDKQRAAVPMQTYAMPGSGSGSAIRCPGITVR